ncbi:hypothetical protein FRB99_007469 [Tulasnella sp. 403]|nr:hypothetical protein FRB99_007469 [Tulasnella sp. 403]
MPPKKGKGKGKKQGDDEEYWDKLEQPTKPSAPEDPQDEADDVISSKPKRGGFAAGFAGLSLDDAAGNEEEEDFGGLMSAIKSSAAKSKKDKRKKKKWDDWEEPTEQPSVAFADGPPPGQGTEEEEAAAKGDISAPSQGYEMTPEELADLEFGPPKKGKGKKGKKGKVDKDLDEDAGPSQSVEPAPSAEPEAPGTPADEGSEAEDAGQRPLSKKEKERLKKEREKEKRRLEAAAKQKETPTPEVVEQPIPPTPTAVTEAAPTSAPAPQDEPKPEEAGPAKLSKKQKKKLRGEEEKVEAPKTEPKKGDAPKMKGGKIAALREAMEAQRRAREEAERAAEEERRRAEEEERRRQEEEARLEEEKRQKREREQARREQLKKEGKLLTPKQRKEKQQAELRRNALLASGVLVAGLAERPQTKASKSDNRRRRGAKENVAAASEASTSAPQSPAVGSKSLEELPPASLGVKTAERENWDDSEDESEKPSAPVAAAEIKDDWEDDSDDDKLSSAPNASTKATPARNGAVSERNKVSIPETKSVSVSNGKSTANPLPPPAVAEPQPAKQAAEESASEDESDESEEEESSEEELTAAQRETERKKAEAAARRNQRKEEALAARSKDDLRSPICCILGHVDTGKTKLLDKIRQTNVQEGEAGGITQQIGATYFPVDAIKEKTKVVNTEGNFDYKIPGLLVIDTPGHESFTNLRSRGSSLCNIAILVVDIMHGLEQQTLESIRLLRDRKTPFIVALNKIDRMYGWEAIPNNSFRDSLAKQRSGVRKEFEKRTQDTIIAFAEQGLNAKLYYENDNPGRIVSLVPTSAISGEGVPDMIMLLVSLTQQRMTDKLMYLSEVECTVLEVKVIEGLGTTIDVVLSNGILREGDKIVLCGLNGPIVTQIRALLTPQPLRELRVKSAYVHHKEVKAALGVKITGPDLEKAIAGSRLLVCGPDDDEEELRDEVMSDLTDLLRFLDKSGRGVSVQASTLGSLEALLDFLNTSKIPVSGINIGPVHKKDIMRASAMLEKAKELACVLCFDVSVDKEAELLAKDMGIRLFQADIIYHLFDAFTAYTNEILEAKRRDAAPQAIWPCRLKTIACFAKREPIILGVDIIDGTLRIGTPLCVVKTDPATGKKDIINLGKIHGSKSILLVKKSQAGAGVAVKIEHAVYEPARMFGRHFDDKDEVISHITRQSIDVLKESFRKDVSPEEWLLIKQLKPRLGIP